MPITTFEQVRFGTHTIIDAYHNEGGPLIFDSSRAAYGSDAFYYDFSPSVRYFYNAFYQFDIAPALRKQILSATLILRRKSLTVAHAQSNAPEVSFDIWQWALNLQNVHDPSDWNRRWPNFDNADYHYVAKGVSDTLVYGGRTDVTSGDIRIDLSKLPNLAYIQNGLIGYVCFGRRNYNEHGGSIFGVAEDSTAFLELDLAPLPPLAPTNLLPITTQNPRGEIKITWWHSPVYTTLPDPQVASKLTVWQSGFQPKIYTIDNIDNEYTLPANTFTLYQQVFFTVRTESQYNGYGAYSSPSSFLLAATPPSAPILTFPNENASVPAEGGALLEWVYASAYDTTPTGFDIRYKFVEEIDWTYIPKQIELSAMTAPIIYEKKVLWQVRAYGALGDVGPWSETSSFFTIGVPDAPIIINVSNSNRPLISFYATGSTSWEIRINRDGETVYQTGTQSFENIFSHRTTKFLPNGNYMAALRINNRYGLRSAWAERPFAINVISPLGLILKIIDNPTFNIHLSFNNLFDNTAYIYRSEFETENYLRIAKTKNNYFNDFTARPCQQYKYFIRTVDSNFNYADSNIEVGILQFKHTTIAQENTPDNMLIFLGQIDGMPTKNTSFEMEKVLTHFIGRRSAVVQLGELTTKSLSLSFYCSINDYELLEKYEETPKTLILRDWRLGVIYGVITGGVSATRETNGYIVSFSFTQTDYNKEVDLE